MQKIGVIGLGPMGKHFVKALLKSEYDVTVFDIVQECVDDALKQGAKASLSPADLAQKTDVILLALPGNKAVKTVMEQENGLLIALKKGQIVVDTGTSHPDLDAMYEHICEEKGASFIDAPVIWRKTGLLVMASGKEDVFKSVENIIASVSYKYKYVGAIGRAQVLKSINQMIFSNMHALWSEVVEYSAKNNIGKELLVDFLEFDVDDRLFGDDFSRKSGAVETNYKDLLYVIELAHEVNANIPLTNATHEAFKSGIARGDGKLDQNAVVHYWRELNKENN